MKRMSIFKATMNELKEIKKLEKLIAGLEHDKANGAQWIVKKEALRVLQDKLTELRLQPCHADTISIASPAPIITL